MRDHLETMEAILEEVRAMVRQLREDRDYWRSYAYDLERRLAQEGVRDPWEDRP